METAVTTPLPSQINPRGEVPETVSFGLTMPKDAIYPIYQPKFVYAEDAPYQDDELVMGVTLNGEAKAYNVSVLRFRELVNDELGGTPILVSWWPICYTGMVHDRRIDGKAHIFGNASTLYKNAMTWYDHETDSIWSQPWGRALQGEHEGVELFLLPFQLTTWENWKTAHPHTLAMTNDWELLIGREEFDPDFVIGLLFAENNEAYYYGDVAAAGVINDTLGEFPVVVWARDNNYQVYLRTVDDRTLTFIIQGDNIIDEETGSIWDLSRGLATDGPLAGQGLQAVPSLSAFDWAWTDFYPQSTFYQP